MCIMCDIHIRASLFLSYVFHSNHFGKDSILTILACLWKKIIWNFDPHSMSCMWSWHLHLLSIYWCRQELGVFDNDKGVLHNICNFNIIINPPWGEAWMVFFFFGGCWSIVFLTMLLNNQTSRHLTWVVALTNFHNVTNCL